MVAKKDERMKLSPAYNKSKQHVEQLSQAQLERLAFIDFNLQFFGKASRSDLIQRFKTGLAASTRDFAAYRDIAEHNLHLDHSSKQYIRSEHFEPVFVFSADSILQSISRGFSDGITAPTKPSERCFEAIQLIHPNIHIIAALMRGIHNQAICEVNYVSVSSGETKRTIVPHALINNGHRWHVRAFDCKSESFRDFVCTRFTSINVLDETALLGQKAQDDEQFNKIVSLTLIVHPDIQHPRSIELDFAMTKGEKIMGVRAALAAYVLRYWQVDCSKEHRILNQGCQLALKNHEVLMDIDNPQLVPGYQK